MDTENHNDSSNQREIRNNTVEAMDTEEGKWSSVIVINVMFIGFYVSEIPVEVLCNERKPNSNCL